MFAPCLFAPCKICAKAALYALKKSTGPLAALGTMKFAEKRLLQVLLHNTGLQLEILSGCASQDLEGLAAGRIFSAILEALRNNEIATFDSLHRRFAGEAEQALLARLQIEEVPEDLSLASAASFYSALRKIRLDSYKREILSKIDEAAQRKDDELVNRLIEQRTQVDRELISLSEK